MNQMWWIAGRALLGGLFVMVFAVVGEMLTPKRFAGVFAAAPAVAIAGMTVTVFHQPARGVRARHDRRLGGAGGVLPGGRAARPPPGRFPGFPGGVFLAFPAILGATLTLIEEEEHSRDPVVQDARGAALGATGMIAFAVTVWALAVELPAPAVLGLATLAWAAAAGTLYQVFGSR